MFPDLIASVVYQVHGQLVSERSEWVAQYVCAIVYMSNLRMLVGLVMVVVLILIIMSSVLLG